MTTALLVQMETAGEGTHHRATFRRLSTGSPEPPPVWQMICEFANGYCVCAATREDGPPCHAVAVIEQRVRNRVALDDLRRAERRAKA